MSHIMRSARVAYDNISVGNATGRERTIFGQTPSTEFHNGGSNVAYASTEPTTTNDHTRDRMLTVAQTGRTTLMPREYPVNQN